MSHYPIKTRDVTWQQHYDIGLPSLPFFDWSAFDLAGNEICNKQAATYIESCGHAPRGLVGTFVGQVTSATNSIITGVSANAIVVRQLLHLWMQLGVGDITHEDVDRVYVTSVNVGTSKGGATVWTTPHVQQLLLQYGHHKLQITPQGFYMAVDEIHGTILAELDGSKHKPKNTTGFPSNSVKFERSRLWEATVNNKKGATARGGMSRVAC